MNNVVSINTDNYSAMAKAMGLEQESNKPSSNLARLKVSSLPIMGEEKNAPNLNPYQCRGAKVIASSYRVCAKILAHNEKVDAGIIAYFALIKEKKSFSIEQPI